MRESTLIHQTLNILVTTVANEEDARLLARESVRGKLAACAQIQRIESHYVWNGDVCADAEWRIDFKTLALRLPALERWLRETHPYEVPQVIIHEVKASPEYANWAAAQLAQ